MSALPTPWSVLMASSSSAGIPSSTDDCVVFSLLSDDQLASACLEYLNKALGSLGTSPSSPQLPGGPPICDDSLLIVGENSISSPTQKSSFGWQTKPSLPYQPRSSPPLIQDHNSTTGGAMMCLASVLASLSECDEMTIFSVRKINKLGFKSYNALKKYFSQFGIVLAIYFLPYRYKPDTASVRPSSMAFVRMASPESVQHIFALGETHVVRDCLVTVQPFTRNAAAGHLPGASF